MCYDDKSERKHLEFASKHKEDLRLEELRDRNAKGNLSKQLKKDLKAREKMAAKIPEERARDARRVTMARKRDDMQDVPSSSDDHRAGCDFSSGVGEFDFGSSAGFGTESSQEGLGEEEYTEEDKRAYAEWLAGREEREKRVKREEREKREGS